MVRRMGQSRWMSSQGQNALLMRLFSLRLMLTFAASWKVCDKVCYLYVLSLFGRLRCRQQATEEELEELIKSLDLENGVLDQILPRWLHHRSGQLQRPSSAGARTSAAYHRKPLTDWPWLRPAAAKRNAELINSLLGLPRIMKVVG